MDYDIIIGLEIHVQLQTESKMFSWGGTEFGLPPNTQTDPVSLGLPGTLPVMNRKAFDLALKTAVALHAEIAPFTKWDRKNYYYPDLPKNYQISQYDLPFSRGGWIAIPQRKDGGGGGRCGLTRVHLEEDTGKLMHAAGGLSEVDLNRAGIPLLEIVTEPDIRSPADARGCLEELRLTLRYLGVSDCEMQEGSLRCDANVNLHIHKDGKKIATPIVEIKNLNSFRAVEKALMFEVDRQYQKWLEDGLTIKDAPKTTRGWSDVEEVTKPQREKETAADYRYFPEPDLVPVAVDEAWLVRIRESIGELPAARRQRFETEYGLSPYDANVLVEQGHDVADYYDAVARTMGDYKPASVDASAAIELSSMVVRATGEYKLASNWIQQDVLRTIKEKKMTVAEFPVHPEQLADLINRVKRGELNTSQGREILGRMIETGDPAEVIIELGGYKMVSDRDHLAAAVAAAIAANPQAIDELKKGKKKPEAVKGFLRGQVMKQTGGKANPALVGELLEAKLAEMEL
jgi:aspartyl-tRNA(Asn)/glutamyl-tRNA(Gln) amidotransferase subunit B